jgi:hypothetical protein
VGQNVPSGLRAAVLRVLDDGVTNWVRNLRAAGRGEPRRKGPTEAFTAIEVDGNERDRVIATFHARSPKPLKQDFDQRPGAADHPTFRVEPIR